MAGKISMVSFLPAWEKVRLRAHLKTRTTRAYSWHLDCVGKSVTLKCYIVRGLRKQTAHASASCTSDARSRAGSSVEARGTRLVLMNHARLMHGNANGRVWKKLADSWCFVRNRQQLVVSIWPGGARGGLQNTAITYHPLMRGDAKRTWWDGTDGSRPSQGAKPSKSAWQSCVATMWSRQKTENSHPINLGDVFVDECPFQESLTETQWVGGKGACRNVFATQIGSGRNQSKIRGLTNISSFHALVHHTVIFQPDLPGKLMLKLKTLSMCWKITVHVT